MQASLIDLGRRYGSDKFTNHNFGPIYERWFEPRREQVKAVLEIGIGGENWDRGGQSLKTWVEYFPHAAILGIDIFDKSFLDGDRLYTRICDQNDDNALTAIAEEFGPFDIIIDDGSHKAGDTSRSLFSLFRQLVPGGLYFIEDTQTSYWAHYGGSSLTPDLYDTSLRWVKHAIDIVNRGECLEPKYFPLSAGLPISEVHAYHNMAILVRTAESMNSVTLTERMRAENLEVDLIRNQAAFEIQQEFMREPHRQLELYKLISLRGGLEAAIRLLT